LPADDRAAYPPLVPLVSSLRRSVASLLAVVALLSATARPVLACEMGRAEPATAHPAEHATDHTAEHPAEHAPTHAPMHAPDAPQPVGCDHLVGCTAMVVAAAPTIVITAVGTPDSTPRTVAAAIDSPVRALEPPPPRG
jgi:hypothetical protein